MFVTPLLELLMTILDLLVEEAPAEGLLVLLTFCLGRLLSGVCAALLVEEKVTVTEALAEEQDSLDRRRPASPVPASTVDSESTVDPMQTSTPVSDRESAWMLSGA
jgi:hypothetical protein